MPPKPVIKRAVAQLEAGNSKWSWLSAAGGLTGEGKFWV